LIILSGDAMAQIDETDARLNSHEALCALRYDAINARLKRLEQILIGTAGFIIITLLGMALKLH
jgi:hypothetical protein